MARRPKTPAWLQAARQSGSAAEKPDWLSRAIARSGALTLPEAEAAIRAGRVKLDGKSAAEPFAPVRPGSTVRLDGVALDVAPTTRVVMLHKPAGVVTSDHDPERRGTVFEVLRKAVPEALARYQWHAVGRLDRDTTGLLLFTNDERFVAHATSPKRHLPKRYLARVGAAPDEEKLARLRAGLVLDDGPCLPAQARLRDGRVELTLTEGRHHQVKRMLGAVGLPVLELHREAIGALVLDVPVGEARLLEDDEVVVALGYRPRHLT